MSRVLPLALCALLGISCATTGVSLLQVKSELVPRFPETVEIFVDERFDQHERNTIQLAVADWNVALNGFIKLDVRPDMYNASFISGIDMMKVDDTCPFIPKGIDEKSMTVAWTDSVGGHLEWFDMDRILTGDMYAIVRHEIGHSLGATHEGGYLMQAIWISGGPTCISRATATEIEVAHNLPNGALSFCTAVAEKSPAK